MESKKVTKTVVIYSSSDNFEKISEESQIIEKKYCQDSDETFGRMKDYIEYLKIFDKKELKISIKDANLISGK